MDHVVTAGLVFVCTLGGALVGMWLRSVLPAHHIDAESKDTVRLTAGLVATMTALVLGLITASAKSTFDELDAGIKHTAQELLTLDRLLARYGPETHEIREALKQAVSRRIDETWPTDNAEPPKVDPGGQLTGVERLADAIHNLSPQTESQRALRDRAVELTEALLQARWMGFGGLGSSVPTLFLVALMLWLVVAFGSFGLFAPPNTTVIAMLTISALSVASAVFLVLEMDGAFTGVIKVSPEPLRFALSHLSA